MDGNTLDPSLYQARRVHQRHDWVDVTKVQKVPLGKLLILLNILKFKRQERRICAGLRFSTVLAGMCRLEMAFPFSCSSAAANIAAVGQCARLRNSFRSFSLRFMAESPIRIGLKHRLGLTHNRRSDASYPIFTTEYDEVVNAADLSALLPPLSSEQQASFDNASQTFDKLFIAERVEIGASGAVLIRDLQGATTVEERGRTVVSFLIDHSGSMRGLRMISALLAVEGIVDALQSAGIATETLGFTTTSWKGGLSRQAWRWAGKPANPGRLCDLRHIVYADADSTVRHPWHLRMALRSDLLHDNIDGEALMWAAGRLNAERWTRRVICLVSDGAPVDDSTLLANKDQTLLSGHLKAAERRLRKDGFVVGTLIIGRDYAREPEFFERASEPQEAGLALMQLVRRTLLSS